MAPIYRAGAVLSTARSVRSRELPTGVNHLMRRCAEDDPDFIASIPSDVEGYPVTIEVIGRITPRAGP